MRTAYIYFNNTFAGLLVEREDSPRYLFAYDEAYHGPDVSLTLPKKNKSYAFEAFPAFFEGFLPEGAQLEALLRKAKLDRKDYFGQLVKVGADLVGAVTVREMRDE